MPRTGNETPTERHQRLASEAHERLEELITLALTEEAWGQLRLALEVQGGRIQVVRSALERAHK